jgi:amidase
MTAQEFPRICHGFTDDALARHDATALAALLRSGEVSASEIMEAAIARAREVEPFINGLAHDNFDQALATARQLDSDRVIVDRPRFTGIPTLIKDNTEVADLSTGHGTAAITPRPADHTSGFARQLLAQGFICAGKSTLPEFGFNATTEPTHDSPTRNPWNLAYSTGASSGGSAALVAAGVIPVAHANDGGGSIRIPAACCGLIGLKYTRGRLVDNAAAKSLPINIVSEGIVSRSVRDTAGFAAEAEQYYRNPRLQPISHVEAPSDKRYRIGLVLDPNHGPTTDSKTRQVVEQTARRLEQLGHEIVPIEVPVYLRFSDDFALYWAMLAFGIRLGGKRLIQQDFDHKKVDGLTLGLDRMFRRRILKMPGAMKRLRHAAKRYAAAISGLDAVLTPTVGHTTPAIGHLKPDQPFEVLFEKLRAYACFTPVANVTGAPAISVPAGVTDSGLPVSVQLMGRHGDERTLLDLAYTLEQDNPWHRYRDQLLDERMSPVLVR